MFKFSFKKFEVDVGWILVMIKDLFLLLKQLFSHTLEHVRKIGQLGHILFGNLFEKFWRTMRFVCFGGFRNKADRKKQTECCFFFS
jgi:hypothetical protein